MTWSAKCLLAAEEGLAPDAIDSFSSSMGPCRRKVQDGPWVLIVLLASLNVTTGCLHRGQMRSGGNDWASGFVFLPVLEEEPPLFTAIQGRKCPFCLNRGHVRHIHTEELGSKPTLISRIRKEVSLNRNNFFKGYDRRLVVRVQRRRIRHYFVCENQLCMKKWCQDEIVDE